LTVASLVVQFVRPISPPFRKTIPRARFLIFMASGSVGFVQAKPDAVDLADRTEPQWPGLNRYPALQLLCELNAIAR